MTKSESNGEIIIYESGDGTPHISVRVENETVWLDAHQMADLFGIDRSGIVKHIKNIYETGELEPKTTCAKIAQVAKDGKKRQMDTYNLDVIISVGYRVNSIRGTHFRIWATKRLKEYIVKGFTMDDERLKASGGGNYLMGLIEELCPRGVEFRALGEVYKFQYGKGNTIPTVGGNILCTAIDAIVAGLEGA
ncbi:MAG: RhuM family protein [Thermodesulfobacteriota bacterium]|nr:RhuM family protein [Thermodesulfobacteriota bacterium]